MTALIGVVLWAAGSYEESIIEWRRHRLEKLTAGDGWLSVVGLHWLHEGENRPVREAGVFTLHDGRVVYGGRELRADTAPGGPDTIRVGTKTLFVIHRGERFAVREKDTNSPLRKEFTGLRYYPVRGEYRVTARWIPYTPAKKLRVPNVLGEVTEEPSPGYAVFRLRGRELRLDPVLDEGKLMFVFRDLTSGKTTYGSGRFLDAALAKNGKVILDFNQAYNPPCAFTPYATCPLPPPQNRLPIAIEAGELRYGNH